MRKIFAFLGAIVFSFSILFAQEAPPQAFSFKAAIKDNRGRPVLSRTINLRISILQGYQDGPAVYSEYFTPNTNQSSQVDLMIGRGTVLDGNFQSIDWSAGDYYLKIELDARGGTNYTLLSVTQLLSVPFALYAASAGNASKKHYVGEIYGGGIVAYVYDNGQHGLIAATSDQSFSIPWSWSGTIDYTMARADGIGAGRSNTTLIIARQAYSSGNAYAARACNEYSVTVDGVTYGDWYLPSKYELSLLYIQKDVIGGFVAGSNTPDGFIPHDYWSSTEYDKESAWAQYFGDGTMQIRLKENIEDQIHHVRAIREF